MDDIFNHIRAVFDGAVERVKAKRETGVGEGSCDCCGEYRKLHRAMPDPFGIETWACSTCGGWEDEDELPEPDLDEYEATLSAVRDLMANPATVSASEAKEGE
jgi:hypothetical protein